VRCSSAKIAADITATKMNRIHAPVIFSKLYSVGLARVYTDQDGNSDGDGLLRVFALIPAWRIAGVGEKRIHADFRL
jgi:hypothetical protein